MPIKSLYNKQQGALYAITSGLCYGLTGYFGISLINSGLSIFNMLFWRFFISAVFIIVLMLPKHKTFLQICKNDIKMLFCGIIFYGASTITYFMSSKYVGTGVAMVILFTYPAFVMLFNVLLYKVRLNSVYYFAFFMLTLGIICLIDIHELTFDVFGIGFGILASFAYACYMLASKKSPSSPMMSTLMVSAGCATTCLIVACVDSSFCVPNGLNVWINILGIAIICTALPILLLLKALKYINTEKASMLSVLEPVFVVIFGILLLNENITALKIIGIITILSGALITIMYDKRNNKN